MPTPPDYPADYGATRDDLHRVAVHVMARRRFALTGRFGLRATAGGFGTPLFGGSDREETLRVSGPFLVHEHRDDAGPHTTMHALDGTSLARLAAAVDVALDPGFSVGKDTPELGDPDAPLSVSAGAVAVMADVLAVGAGALDGVLADLGTDAGPIVAQLWPEHFDLGLDVGVGSRRVNLGASVGDRHHDTPYFYVGPWTPERPGDPEFWNVGFGALVGFEAVAASPDPVATVVEFFHRGLGYLR